MQDLQLNNSRKTSFDDFSNAIENMFKTNQEAAVDDHKRAGIFPSTLLQLVNDSKNPILI